MTGSLRICTGFLLAAHAMPQSVPFAGPTSGFVYVAGSRTVRPLLGVPGATYLGTAVLNEIDTAWIAPEGKWALVGSPSRPTFVRGLSAVPYEVPIDGTIAAVDRVAWSNDASFAALYSASGAQIQRVALAGQLTADPPVDLSACGSPSAIAIDPTGRRIVFTVAGTGLFALDKGGVPVLLLPMQRPAAVTFSDTGRLYALDAETRTIVEFNSNFAPSDFAVVEPVPGFDPVGLAVAATGKYLMLAERSSRTIRVFDTVTRTAAYSIPLDFTPAHLERLSTGAVFLLNRPRPGDWLQVLEASGVPRVYFVPGPGEVAQ